jgi:SAM-dependent methyltransferase
MTGNPFVDPAIVPGLYAGPDRIIRRTDALLQAKTTGRNAAEVIAGLAVTAIGEQGTCVHVLDVGCGRGSTTMRLADSLEPVHVVGLDAGHTLLASARRRAPHHSVNWACADFHRLPFPDRTFTLAIAAFCLYHAPDPIDAVAEIGRCLASGGVLVAATKSADSYAELDRLLTDTGLDPEALTRPSLYSTFHSGNLTDVLAAGLVVDQVVHEGHGFRFTGPCHLARYLHTSPKYSFPSHLARSPRSLSAALTQAIGDVPVWATSTVSYAVAHRP